MEILVQYWSFGGEEERIDFSSFTYDGEGNRVSETYVAGSSFKVEGDCLIVRSGGNGITLAQGWAVVRIGGELFFAQNDSTSDTTYGGFTSTVMLQPATEELFDRLIEEPGRYRDRYFEIAEEIDRELEALREAKKLLWGK